MQMTTTLQTAKKARNLLVASHALQHIAMTALPPLLLFIAFDVGLTGTELGFIVAAGSVASGLFQMPAGWLADKFSARQLLLVGYCLTLSGLFLLSQATSLSGFIIAQVFYGMGNSTFHPASFADVGRAARHSGGLAMNMALHNIGGNVGTAAGYAVSGLLATFFGWRSALLTLVGAGAVLVVGFYLSYPRLDDLDEDEENEVAATVDQEDEPVASPRPKVTSWTPVYVIAAATLLAGVFDSGIMNWLPTFFTTTRGSSAAAAALFSTIMMLAGAGGSLAGGSLGDRFHRGNIILISTTATAVVLAAVVLLPIEGVVLTVAVIIKGFFHSLARPSLSAITSEISPRGMSGTAFGLIFGVMALGGAIAGPMVGYIYDHASLNLAFLILAAFLLCYGITIAAVTYRYRLSGRKASRRSSVG